MIAKILLILPLCILMAQEYNPKNRVSVTIILHDIIGHRALWTYELDNNHIRVTRHASVERPDSVIFERNLTYNEKKKLSRFFGGFPIHKIEKKYIGRTHTGDSCSIYRIKINAVEKGAYVYYSRPEELLELNRFINRLLPRRFRLWDEG
ncbi:MAG: hypothetical protein JW807_02065 [Spirochaetes bacterium]|nr:hypothetical protein [Spirochaetota bacterium]